MYKLKYKEAEKKILEIVQKFDNQRLPGELFGVEEEVVVPKFKDVIVSEFRNISFGVLGYNNNREPEIDVKAQGDSEQWIIEIKNTSLTASSIHRTADQLQEYKQALRPELPNIKAWLVMMEVDRIPFRGYLREKNILSSTKLDIEKLEKLVGS